MALVDLLERPIAYHRAFRVITGSTVAAVMLSQALYHQKRADNPNHPFGLNGWWYKNQEEWEKETGLSRSEQETARARLKKLILMTEQRKGQPSRLWYKVDMLHLEKKLEDYHQIAGISQSSRQRFRNLDCGISTNKSAGIPQSFYNVKTETTTKITSQTTTTPIDHLTEQPRPPSKDHDNDCDEEQARAQIFRTMRQYPALAPIANSSKLMEIIWSSLHKHGKDHTEAAIHYSGKRAKSNPWAYLMGALRGKYGDDILIEQELRQSQQTGIQPSEGMQLRDERGTLYTVDYDGAIRPELGTTLFTSTQVRMAIKEGKLLAVNN